MKYTKRKHYKYRLYSHFHYQVDIKTIAFNPNKYIGINTSGQLWIYKGYTWDGASNPAIDTDNFMIASLVHDALYQLIREGVIDKDDKDKCDRILRKICLEQGMSKLRSWWVYQGVKRFGYKAIRSRVITV